MVRRGKVAILTATVISLAPLIAACTGGGSGNNAASANATFDLPRSAWDGGPAYWDQFPVAKAAGWANPSFFPIVIWDDSVSSSAEAQADKSYGINTYIGEPTSVNYNDIAENHMFVLTKLDNAPAAPGNRETFSRTSQMAALRRPPT